MGLPLGGQCSDANPIGLSGLISSEAIDLEFWPRGSAARRRGFDVCVSTVTATGTALYDLFAFDRWVGSARRTDLLARGGDGKLYKRPVLRGSTFVTSSQWATLSAGGWSTTGAPGRWFTRKNFAYYSDGTQKRGFDSVLSSFAVGLSAPSGTYKINLVRIASRMEPGYYDYTFTCYDQERNVFSMPNGFTTPSTKAFYAGSTLGGLSLTNKMGATPGIQYSIAVGASALTFPSPATLFNIWRRHPYTLYQKPARSMDDVRQVTTLAVTDTTFVDSLGDDELGEQLSYWYSPPDAWTAACNYQDYYWYTSKSEPWKLWHSQVDAPEQVAKIVAVNGAAVSPFLTPYRNPPIRGESWLAPSRRAGAVQALLNVGSMMLVLCENQLWHVVGQGPGSFHLHALDNSIGCAAPETAVQTPFGSFWFSQEGIVWWRGGKPKVISKGWLDFDTAGSTTRLNRSLLPKAVAAYDSARETVEFAVPSYGSTTGNNFIIALDVGISTPEHPMFAVYAPALAATETITSMTNIQVPMLEPFVVYGTSTGRLLYRTGSADDNATTMLPIQWMYAYWVGTGTPNRMKSNFGVKIIHNAGYDAMIGSSVWARNVARRPGVGEAAASTGQFAASSRQFAAIELGTGAEMFYCKLRETSSTPFLIQDIVPGYTTDGGGWRTE